MHAEHNGNGLNVSHMQELYVSDSAALLLRLNGTAAQLQVR